MRQVAVPYPLPYYGKFYSGGCRRQSSLPRAVPRPLTTVAVRCWRWRQYKIDSSDSVPLLSQLHCPRVPDHGAAQSTYQNTLGPDGDLEGEWLSCQRQPDWRAF